MSWTEAKAFCENLGGHLATITSEEEQVFIENLLAREGSKNCYWLGGYCGDDLIFQWVTGENFSYTKWSPGQPDNSSYHGGQDKIDIWRVDDPNNGSVRANFWDDTHDNVVSNPRYGDFDKQRGFICEYEAITAPSAPEKNAPANMVWVTGGTFTIGSPSNEVSRSSNEGPQHQVTISKGFYLGKYEVTVEDFRQFVNATGYKTEAETSGGGYVWTGSKWEMKADANWKNPYFAQNDNHPVVLVSWNDAVKYCNWKSEWEGLTPAYTVSGSTVTWNKNASGYRLPTEAEWEYACRAGTTSPFNTGSNITTSQANYTGNYPYNGNAKGTYRGQTTAVGSFAANSWGLYDMHGNVWEWCWDWYGDYASGSQTDPTGAASGAARVSRGGSWSNGAEHVRSAVRGNDTPSSRGSHIGFRLVRPLSVPPPIVTAPPAPVQFVAASVNQSSPGLYVGSEYQGEMDIYDAVDWIALNVQDGGEYSIVLGSDQKVSNISFDYGDKKVTISLKAVNGERKVTYDIAKPSYALFTVKAGVTFTLEENVVLSGVQNAGGSLVDVNGGTFIMNGGAIKDNKKSGNGGGVIVDNSGVFTMNNGVISGNTASGAGGGVYVRAGTFTMNEGTINGNTNSSYGGGGVYVNTGTFTMHKGVISGNTNSSGGGGGVYVNTGSFTMNNGTINGNTNSSGGGGGVWVEKGTFTMNNGVISENTTGSGGGGVVVFSSGGTFTMNNGTISGNSSSSYGGGGVWVGNGSAFTMQDGAISGNTASDAGGGVIVYKGGTFTKSGRGGIIYGSNVPEGANNSKTGNGHAVYVDGGLKRDNTARATMAMDSKKSGPEGGWD
jgi:formylglycine-generating enzyme required for sulfatase activity